jgi:hypothetical protein
MINYFTGQGRPQNRQSKILPVPNANGKKIDLVFVEGDSSVYEAKAWREGKRVVVANMID